MPDPTPARTAPPSAAQPLFILAMDHRASFGRTLFGVTGTPDGQQAARMREAKSLIFDAASAVTAATLGPGRAGILVDEQLGADVARKAKQAGFVLAMPVEVSGSGELAFEYGDGFGEHVTQFDPDWVKVLVRFNPADPAGLRQSQIAALGRLRDWVTAAHRHWLIELIVPPTREQLAAHDGQAYYDRDVRPALTAQAIAAFAAAGIHPGIWKLEGYETTAGANLVLDAVRATGSPPSSCIVLGRDAPRRQVDHWLTVAAPLEDYAGFAIGRSIWEEPIADHLAGRTDRGTTKARIAERYSHFIERYLAADTMPRQDRDTEPFTRVHPRLTPDREAIIRKALEGADMRGTFLPAWMTQTLLAEVDALRAEA
jgi:myo-inositol catabolism protein IolC